MMQSSPHNPLYRRFLQRPEGVPPMDKWHHYFDVYLAEFAPFRGKPVTMLEIGVQNGGSTRLWRDFLGPEARVFGLDIDPACAGRVPDGIKVFIGDQADPNFLRAVLAETGPLDIVLDDGGHTMRQQITSFEVLYPAVRAPGVYLIEDTHTAFFEGTFQDDPQGRTIYDLAFEACRKLQDWTRREADLRRLRTPPPQRPPRPEVSEICRRTRSIAFHDSMIIFRRQDREEPWSQTR